MTLLGMLAEIFCQFWHISNGRRPLQSPNGERVWCICLNLSCCAVAPVVDYRFVWSHIVSFLNTQVGPSSVVMICT